MAFQDKIQNVSCVICTDKNGAAIWKKVGVKMKSKSGKDVILLDRTFNPAGVLQGDKESSSIALYLFDQELPEQTQERKQPYKKPFSNTSFADFDDDIPF